MLLVLIMLEYIQHLVCMKIPLISTVSNRFVYL
uniref:Uncharacterized protein n=1 Tax=Siphoviridae sp. ctmpG14 TaxID=2825654 RepID=A0A8S5PAM9_9CAUD|nr:MAG TPA: hypothetical protein [Siphoviridae sp. ctmpG14]